MLPVCICEGNTPVGQEVGPWLVSVRQAWMTVPAAMMRTNGLSCDALRRLHILTHYSRLL